MPDPKNSLEHQGSRGSLSGSHNNNNKRWRTISVTRPRRPLRCRTSTSSSLLRTEARVVEPRDAIKRLQEDLNINQQDVRAKPPMKPTERDSENKIEALKGKLYANENSAEDSNPRNSPEKNEGDKARMGKELGQKMVKCPWCSTFLYFQPKFDLPRQTMSSSRHVFLP